MVSGQRSKKKNCSRVLLRRTITGRLNKRFTGSIDLPIQNYVRDKENEFNRKNESGQTWDEAFKTLKQNLVDEQQYKDSSSY